MPIKKKTDLLEKDNVKCCPYCDNEIKAKAVKCQYCGEFLNDEYEENGKRGSKNTKTHVTDGSRLSALNIGKALYRCCIVLFVLFGLAFLGGYFNLDFIYSEAFGIFDTLLGLTLLILQMIWSNKSYNHLLNKGCKNLRFSSAGRPTRGWICPIACLFIPYQAVSDIYKTYNEKSGIIGWWWTCYLGNLVCSIIPEEVLDGSSFMSLLSAGFVIAEYILLFIIVKNINKSLEDEK